MRIAVVEIFGRGGLTHYVYNLADALGRRGHEVTIHTAADYELTGRLGDLPAGVRVESAFSRLAGRVARRRARGPLSRRLKGIEFFWDAPLLALRLRRLNPDVVHVHCTNAIVLWLLLLLRFLRRPVVWTAHDVTPHERSRFGIAFQRATYALSDHVIAHSEHDLGRLAKEFRVGLERISVVPHGDYSFFGASRGDGVAGEGARSPSPAARRRLGLPEDAEVVLFFGFIREYKGLDLLLDAWPEVARDRSLARLVVAGEPTRLAPGRRDALESRALSLGAVVRFGYVPFEEVPDYFGASDLVVLPYRGISQSGVLLLALSAGVPVIATKVGAFPEALDREGGGILIEPDDPAALAAGIVSLLSDPTRRRRLGKAGRRRARERFAWPAIAERTERIFTHVCPSDAPGIRNEGTIIDG